MQNPWLWAKCGSLEAVISLKFAPAAAWKKPARGFEAQMSCLEGLYCPLLQPEGLHFTWVFEKATTVQ